MATELNGPWKFPPTPAYAPAATKVPSVAILAGNIADTGLQSLEICSGLLQGSDPGAVLSVKLDNFSALIQQLKDLLENDHSMDHELRSLLLRHVNAMIVAIGKAKFWGVSILHKAFAETLGDILLKPNVVARTSGNQKTWEKASQMLTVMTAALSFATTTIQVTQSAQPAQITVVNQMPSTGMHEHH